MQTGSSTKVSVNWQNKAVKPQAVTRKPCASRPISPIDALRRELKSQGFAVQISPLCFIAPGRVQRPSGARFDQSGKRAPRVFAVARGQGHRNWGSYLFDLKQRSVTLSGRHIPLTDKEFDLAHLLFRNLSLALSREVIMRTVWGHEPDEPSRTLDVHIAQLRTRLGLNPKNGMRLTSVFRFGYRLERLDAWDQTRPRGVGDVAGL
jgi:DNA-binding winged helix-turn-helix (wHTH) protein